MAEENGSHSYILFDLAGSTYGVRSREVQHIEMVENLTPVPNAPSYVEGVVYSRGQVIPAINLRRRFGFARENPTLKSRLIIVQSGPRRVGLIVDAAREFRKIPTSAVQPPPESVHGLSGNYLHGIALLDQRLIFLIDINEILSLREASQGKPLSQTEVTTPTH